MNKIKSMLAGASLVALGAAPVFAEGTTPTMDTTAAAGAVTALQTGITSLINNTIVPAVVVIILAFAGLWGVQLVWKKIRATRG